MLTICLQMITGLTCALATTVGMGDALGEVCVGGKGSKQCTKKFEAKVFQIKESIHSGMRFEKEEGLIVYDFISYGLSARMFLVVDVSRQACAADSGEWKDESQKCYLWWDAAKTFMQKRGIEYDVLIEKKRGYKYGIKLGSIPEDVQSVLSFVGLRFEKLEGTDWSMVKQKGYALYVGNLRLGFKDLVDSGFDVTFLDKKTLFIGGVSGQSSLWLDPTTDYLSGTEDAQIIGRHTSGNYASARASSWLDLHPSSVLVGQKYVVADNDYYVYRSYISFDTSAIPDGATVTDVTLTQTIQGNSSTAADFDVDIYDFAWAGPIAAGNREANYDAVGAVFDATWKNTTGISVGAEYTSPSLDTDWINKTGDTKYQLRSSREVSATQPTGLEYVGIYVSAGADEPSLTITYAEPFNSEASGDWNVGATWGNAGAVEGTDYPGSGDDVIIDEYDVTLVADQSAASLNLTGGELSLGTNALNVSGNWSYTSGTFTSLGGTVVFLATDTDNTIQVSGMTFYNLVLNGTGGTWKAQDQLDVDGTVNIIAGTLDTNGQSAFFADDFYIGAGGDFIKGAGTVVFDGNMVFADNSANGVDMGYLIIGNSPEVTELGTNLIASSLTINAGDRLITHGFNIDIAGNIDIKGTIDATEGTGGASIIQVGGNWIMDADGAFIEGSSTVIFDGTDTNNSITSSGEAFNDVFLNDGLVGYWKMDETTVTANVAGAIDSSGYGNVGIWRNNVKFEGNTPDLNFVNVGSAYFDGTGDYIDMTQGITLAYNVTVSAWIYAYSSVSNETIWGGCNDPDNACGGADFDAFSLRKTNADKLMMISQYARSSSGYSYYTSTDDIPLELWFHATALIMPDNIDSGKELWINGESVARSTLYLGLASGAVTIYPSIGSLAYGNNGIDGHVLDYKGFVDDLRIYNRALTPTEIGQLAQGNPAYGGSGEYLLADALDVDGDLIIAGGTLDTGGKNITVAGSLFNYGGIFEHDNAGSVTLDGPGTSNVIQSGSNFTFYNLVVNNASGQWSALSDIHMDNSLLITAGEMTVHASIDAIEFAGTLAVGTSGTFTGGSTKLVTHNGDLETTTSATYTATSGFTRITADTDLAASTFTAGSGTVIFSASDTDNTITAVVTQFNDVDLGDGLVGYWKLDEAAEGDCAGDGSNYDACDSSGNGNHGEWANQTAASDITRKPFAFTNIRSIELDGTDDYIDMGDPAALNINRFTISVWVKSDVATGVTSVYWNIVQRGDSYTNGYGLQFYDDGTPDFQVWTRNGGSYYWTDSLLGVGDLTIWRHIVGTYDGASVKIYLDGILQDSVSASDPYTGAEDFRIGDDGVGGGSDEWDGLIDDVRVYNRALSVQEINALALSEVYGTIDGIFTLGDKLDVDGSIAFASNTLDVSATENNELFIAGDWIMTDGSFNSRAGSVTFDGGDALQNVTGNTTFYDLWKIDYTNNSTDASLLFEAGSSTRITNELKLVGVDINDRVRLDSSDGSTEFVLDVTGGDQSVSFVTVSNSNATSNNIDTVASVYGNGTDQGTGRPNWIFSNFCISIASTSWSTASTWDCGAEPTSANAVLIDGETVTLTSTAQVEDIIISSGVLNLDGYRIEVGGKWNKTGGTFTPGTGTVVFSSTAGDESITSSGAAFNDVMFNDGLVGFWQLDDTSSPALDSTENDNNMTWYGDPESTAYTAGLNYITKKSQYLDGNDYFKKSISNYRSGDSVGTITAWIKTATGVRIFSSADEGGTEYYLNFNVSGTGHITLEKCDNDTWHYTLSTTTSVYDGKWHHVVLLSTGTEWKMYVDGKLQSLNVFAQDNDGDWFADVANRDNIVIGMLERNAGPENYFTGYIDEVRIYNRVLSAEQILIMAQGNPANTYVAEHTLVDTLDVDGDLIIASGKVDTGGNNITLAGSFYNYGGVFEHGNAGSVTLDGAGTGSELQSGSNFTFFNLVVNNAAGTWSALSDIYVDNSILISAGELDVHASIDAVEFAGTLAVGTSGTFTGGSTKLVTHNGDLETTTSATYTATSFVTRMTADVNLATGTFTDSDGTVIFSASDMDNDITSNGEQFNDVFLGDGLVGYWKLDETSTGDGDFVEDSSGKENHGTFSGASASSTSVPRPFKFSNDRSVDFDGTTDFVSVAHSASLNNLFTGTISAWIYWEGAGREGVVRKGDDAYEYELVLDITSDKLFLAVNLATTEIAAYSDAAIPNNQWVHVAGSWDNNKVGWVYVAGVQQSTSSTGAGANVSNTEALDLGNWDRGESREFDGKIDEVRIYNRALSTPEVKALATSEAYGTADGIFILEDKMDVDGSITFASNTLDVNVSENNDLFVAGDWTMTDGSFNSRAGSVTFDGGDALQNITGDTTFYDLWKIDYTNNSTDASLLFEAGSSTRITNNLKLVGIDVNDRVRLDSSDGTTQFVLDVIGGDQSVSFVTVSNSNATSNDINTIASWYGSGTDQGSGTPNWIFSSLCTSIASTAWSTASTWDCGIEPTSAYAVLIDGETVTLTTTAQAEDVTISAGVLDLAGYRIEVGGKWNKTGGTFTPGDGTVLFNSTNTDETITSGSSAFNDVYISDGLVGYWKLDETEGTMAYDSSGYQLHGVRSNVPTLRTEILDLNFVNPVASNFDGSSDYVLVAYQDALFMNTMSFSYWVKSDISNYGGSAYVIGMYDSVDSKRMWAIRVNSVSDEWEIMTSSNGVAVNNVTTNQSVNTSWHHFVFVVNNSTKAWDYYYDGSFVSTITASYTYTNQQSHLGISTTSGTSAFFNGIIDDVRLYSRELLATEIAKLAQGNLFRGGVAEYLISDTLDVNGDLTIAGGTLDTGGKNITVAGSFYNYGGMFEHDDAGSVTFDGPGTGNVIQSGSSFTFYNLVMDNSSAEWTVFSDLHTDNSLLITAGDMSVHSSLEMLEFAGTFAVGAGGAFSGGNLNLITHRGGLEAATGASYTAAAGFTRIIGDLNLKGSTFNVGTSTVIFTASDSDNIITSNNESLHDVIIGEGLIGYWKLDEKADDGSCGNDKDACDSSGNDLHGEWGGSPSASTRSASPFSFYNPGSLDFGNDFIKVDYNAKLFSNIMTVSFWAKSDITNYADNGYGVAMYDSTGNKRVWAILVASNTDNWVCNTSNDGTASNMVSIGQAVETSFRLLTFVVDNQSKSWKFYYDGEYVSTLTAGYTYADLGSFLTIGGLDATNYFDGIIDDVRIYGRALSDSEVKYLTIAEAYGSYDGIYTLQDKMGRRRIDHICK